MINKCPGQDSRNIQAQVIICSSCGYKVEIFSDEIKARCPNCKRLVCKDRLPSCIEWCRAARDCLGEEKFRQLRGNI